MNTLSRILSTISRLARPAARRWARPGYFDPPDLATCQPKRVALVACHWLGDTFWASQVVPALRERFSQAQLYAITKPASADLWAGLIEPEHVIPAGEVVSDRRREPTNWAAIARRARQLRELDLDLVIDLTGNRYSALFTLLLRPGASLGFAGGELGWLYSHRVADAARAGVHLSQQPFRVVAPLLGGRFAYPSALRPPQPTIPPGDLLARLGLQPPLAVIAPGAGWAAKQWPADDFARVAGELANCGWRIVCVGSASQRGLCGSVAGAAGKAGSVMAGRPIGEVVALLAGAGAVLANDSGIAHLSAALGVQTVAIFTAATDPAVCGPIGQRVRVLVDPDVSAVSATIS